MGACRSQRRPGASSRAPSGRSSPKPTLRGASEGAARGELSFVKPPGPSPAARPRCFITSGDGAAALLSALARCRDLQDAGKTAPLEFGA